MSELRTNYAAHLNRRSALQLGAMGALGATAGPAVSAAAIGAAKSVLFVFVNGGVSQHDSFDLKPDAPSDIRGEFLPILTATPGIQICEHLPMLAQRTNDYALLRTIATDSSGHEEACHMLFTGRLDLPPGFSLLNVPNPNEWPSIAAQVTYALRDRGGLPPAAVLPQPSVNEAAKVRPGQYAGRIGKRYEAWHLDIAAKCALGNGACPHCFRFGGEHFVHESQSIFDVPVLSLPDGGAARLSGRVGLLDDAERQRGLGDVTALDELERNRRQALSILEHEQTRRAFDVERADPAIVERYGRNKFGLSLLMGSRLLEAGVRLVQVNLGKNSSWDTHVRNFANLKQNLFPYFDQAVSALLDDLRETGRLDDTLVIITGEFGRTPKINKDAGRDHWGPVMTSMFAGGGVRGGQVIGQTDALGAYPIFDRVTVEDVAATMFSALGIPHDQEWHDVDGRPHAMYRGAPIAQLYG